MEDELIQLAKRLADYVRLTEEIGGIKVGSPMDIACKDFLFEWEEYSRLKRGKE